MASADLLDRVAVRLANDADFLSFKGLNLDSPNEEKAEYIVKDEETEGVVTAGTIPICLIYERPGKDDVRTSQLYIATFVVECYAEDGNKARRMSDRAFELLHNWGKGYACRQSYATSFKTGIVGVSGHRRYYQTQQFVG